MRTVARCYFQFKKRISPLELFSLSLSEGFKGIGGEIALLLHDLVLLLAELPPSTPLPRGWRSPLAGGCSLGLSLASRTPPLWLLVSCEAQGWHFRMCSVNICRQNECMRGRETQNSGPDQKITVSSLSAFSREGTLHPKAH